MLDLLVQQSGKKFRLATHRTWELHSAKLVAQIPVQNPQDYPSATYAQQGGLGVLTA
jgi:hypothetical protein